MKTILIKGREYVPVVERVKEFHSKNNKGMISTEILSAITNDKIDRVSVKATVTLDDGRIFTGMSQAKYHDKMMGDVALEIAETSAIGRALGFANIGLIDGIASADEMRKAGKKDDKDDESEPF